MLRVCVCVCVYVRVYMCVLSTVVQCINRCLCILSVTPPYRYDGVYIQLSCVIWESKEG